MIQKDIIPSLNPVAVAILFGILQGILIILFSFKRSDKKNVFLILLVITCLCVQLESFLTSTGYVMSVLFLMNVSTPFIFLIGPLLRAYIAEELGVNYSLKSILPHLAPFFFYLLYSFNFFLQPNDFKINVLMRSFNLDSTLKPFVKTFSEDPWHIQGWVVVEVITLHLCFYWALSFIQILRYKAKASDRKHNETARWTTYLNTAFLLCILVLFFSQGGVVNGNVFMKSPFPHYSADLAVVLFMYFITAFILLNPDTFKHQKPKYSKSGLSRSLKRAKLDKLIALLEGEKIYLHSTFSLETLSQRSGLSKHHISQILNDELNTTFSALTNKYRIEAAINILTTDKSAKIEQIAYQLGYKSKSTFFKEFKKETQITPNEFRIRQVDWVQSNQIRL